MLNGGRSAPEMLRETQPKASPKSPAGMNSGAFEEPPLKHAGATPKASPEPLDAAAASAASARVLRETGNLHFREGRLSEAVMAYTRGIHLDASDKMLWANRSAAFLKLNSPADALRDANNALDVDPLYGKAHHRKGRASLLLGQLDDAAAAFDAAAQAGCHEAEDDLALVKEVIQNLDEARILCGSGRLVAATDLFASVFEHVRMGEELVEEFALLALRAQLYENIIVCVEPVLSLKPLMYAHRTMTIVAVALYRLAFLDRAHALFARALFGGDPSKMPSSGVGAALGSDHFVHELGVVDDLELCVQVRTHTKLGMHLQSEKKYDWAVECYSEALRTDGRTPCVRRWLYHLRGRARCYVAKDEENKPWGAVARVMSFFDEACDDLNASLGEGETAQPQLPTHPEIGDYNPLVHGNEPRCTAAPSTATVGVGVRSAMGTGAGEGGISRRGARALSRDQKAVGGSASGLGSGAPSTSFGSGGVPMSAHWMVESLRWRAFAYHFKGDRKRAMADYAAVLDLDPEDERTKNRLRELQYQPDSQDHVDESPNYYTVLGVSCRASTQEIKTAYAKKVVELHPDRSRTAHAVPPVGEDVDPEDAVKVDDDDELAKKDAATAKLEREKEEARKRTELVTWKMVELQEALTTLTDDELRKMYDQTGYPLRQLKIALRDGDERFQAFTGTQPPQGETTWKDTLKYHLSKMWFYGVRYPCVACRTKEPFMEEPEVPQQEDGKRKGV